jgi:hypothetical protein
MNLSHRLTKIFHAGWTAHKASLDSRNSKGISAIEESALEDTIATIEADLKGLAKELPHSEWCSFVTDERGPREGMCDCYVSKHIAAIEHYTRDKE